MAQSRERRHRTDMLYNAKRRAKNKGVPFELTFDDIEIPETCPYCEKTLVIGGAHSDAPSLDRLIPELGYVPENVHVACVRCNQLCSDMTPEDMYRLADVAYELIKKRGLRGRTRSKDRA